MLLDKDVAVPMRDGARLKADVFRPDDGGKFPAILNLGPYGKDVHLSQFMPEAWEALKRRHPEILKASSCAHAARQGLRAARRNGSTEGLGLVPARRSARPAAGDLRRNSLHIQRRRKESVFVTTGYWKAFGLLNIETVTLSAITRQ